MLKILLSKGTICTLSLINIAASSDKLEILQILRDNLITRNIKIKNTRIKSYIKDIRKELLLKIKNIKNKK